MKRFYRSIVDKRIAGICGGIAEALDIDSTIVRLVFFVCLFSLVPVALFYLGAWVIIPEDPGYKQF